MSRPEKVMKDGNEATASVAYRVNDLILAFPMTPATPMGELTDAWASQERENLWGRIPQVVKLPSPGGVGGALHGAVQGGALVTSFTASQGLLEMIPSLYAIAGELAPCCIHVATRAVASHASSLYCDHSDVMAARQTGFAFLASSSVQEAHDQALIATVASLRSRVPFLHFFDGFRTSHELCHIQKLEDEILATMLGDEMVREHRSRALSPDRPSLRGTLQTPEVFFPAREACQAFYQACPDLVQETMDRFGELTGRSYRLFDYVGHPEAQKVLVILGSAAEAAHEFVTRAAADGQRVGLVQVRLFRPFSLEAFASALPPTLESVAVLDRTKEPGSVGEPLYLDVAAALAQARSVGLASWSGQPRVVGGRYGLGSREFDGTCVQAVFNELALKEPRQGFTVGIVDDVTHSSLELDSESAWESPHRLEAVFYALGSDGTVAGNRSSLKILGEETDLHTQAYFEYDSKKAGATTVSHIRLGVDPIRSSYLIRDAAFVACHQFHFLEQRDVLARAGEEATFLLNSPYGPDEIWDRLPREVQETILAKRLRLYVVDAYRLAREGGLGWRISVVMQTCFFALTGILPEELAVKAIKKNLEEELGKEVKALVDLSCMLADRALESLREVPVDGREVTGKPRPRALSQEDLEEADPVTVALLEGKGSMLPVSAFSEDGTWPTGTSRFEKRNVAQEIPVWEPDICIQCAQCALVCPHTAIRTKMFEADSLALAPATYLHAPCKAPDLKGLEFTVQVAPEDCTGCRLCVEICPARDRANPRRKAINMENQRAVREREKANFQHFLEIPQLERSRIQRLDARGSQLLEPLFQYSGACAGCGETPYIKLLTQLFGDRLLIVNAPGCSASFSGQLPTTPFARNGQGRGPAWLSAPRADSAEVGLGLYLAVESIRHRAEAELQGLSSHLGDWLVSEILDADQDGDGGIAAQRQRVEDLKKALREVDEPRARSLEALAPHLVRKSVWIIGGDGWASEAGHLGLENLLGSGSRVNVLVLDTQVYSDTGGQVSRTTPLGAVAKFAARGKDTEGWDLGMEFLSRGQAYVAQIALAARMAQTVQAMVDAESYPGPSLLMAYSPCIAHGFDLARGADQQRLAVATGLWPLYRCDPRNEPGLKIDSGVPKKPVTDFMSREMRFRMAEKLDGERYRALVNQAQEQARSRYAELRRLAGLPVDDGSS